MSAPSFSIIINTYNRAGQLEDAIRSALQVDYPKFEVVVVNGPSTDGSDAIVERYKGVVKALSIDEVNLSVSRNAGIEAAAGDIVCFMDDDAAPHTKWLQHLASAYGDPQVAGAGGFTIDNTGMRWQVQKTICDRYGGGHNVSRFFDERPLNFPGTPFYPSILGTNSSFRRSALEEVGGFDHVFAYFLDETDVCLRLVDAGYHIRYVPDAVVYHQFAASHLRSTNRQPRTLYPASVSKGYFIQRHGTRHSRDGALQALNAHKEEIFRANAWLADHNEIPHSHRHALDADLETGLSTGQELAMQRYNTPRGDMKPGKPPRFKPVSRGDTYSIALVSQSFPPENDAGIARWSQMVAQGLADKGHRVHVIARAADKDETVTFQNGLWVHRVHADGLRAGSFQARSGLPGPVAAWNDRVERELSYIRTFGLDVISFPVWDLEALTAVESFEDVARVMSLHTTYGLARPYKPEWNARPIFGANHIDKVIRGEEEALRTMPVLLANSDTIMDQLEELHGLPVRAKSELIPHGTEDPTEAGLAIAAEKIATVTTDRPLRALYVGRFEPRKGFDLVVSAFAMLLEDVPDMTFSIVGDQPEAFEKVDAPAADKAALLDNPRVSFRGFLSREELEAAYAEADVLIAPSRFESFGLIGIEAFALSTPVVALRIGGLAEVITNEVDGISVPVEEGAEGLAAAVQLITMDREGLAGYMKNARRAFEEKYTAALMVDRIAEFYGRQARAQRKAAKGAKS